MTAADRWMRLETLLTEATGIAVRLHERPYPGGVSRSITLPASNGRMIEIGDAWWSRNIDKWTGYSVAVVGADDIIVHQFPLTKKRSEVVANVTAAMRPRDE